MDLNISVICLIDGKKSWKVDAVKKYRFIVKEMDEGTESVEADRKIPADYRLQESQ